MTICTRRPNMGASARIGIGSDLVCIITYVLLANGGEDGVGVERLVRAELDCEELYDGFPAFSTVTLPMRDTRRGIT